MSKNKVIALLCSDLHLSMTPPIARSAEPNWLDAQMRSLNQLRELRDKHQCQIIYAGDIFDRWGPPVEFVNWVIEALPCGYAIPGQHDLPMHNHDEIGRSAYWTLFVARVIDLLPTGEWSGNLAGIMCGWPYGVQVKDIGPPVDWGRGLNIAVIHAYIWKQGASYENAPKESRYHHWKDWLKGYDVAVFGDNHIHFEQQVDDCLVWNCGCLIPRKSDERGLKPSVGLLYEDGTIGCHLLDVSNDKWIDVTPEQEICELPGVEKFIGELEGLSTDSLDFRDAVRRYITDNKVSPGVKEILLEGLER